jgi:GH25 family lysozyme M1 (1,4-beta-N-acetylmuramidase)
MRSSPRHHKALVPKTGRIASCIAVLAIVCAAAAPVQRARAAAATAPGIDVSQFQGTIDWTASDPAVVRFAILRATKGLTYDDPAFGTNLTDASSAGVVIGAYHRAVPGAAAGDAVAQADHFLAVARNGGGDILPVLDIEESGGLTVSKLQDWVRVWLARVRSRLGVRGMIYASPSFWRTSMGDTTWFADHGYPLWIANWHVAAPDVPASGWAGRGWTLWQWTNTGRVPGITTDVDRDRLSGTDLRRAEIASLSVAAAPGGLIAGPRISCGDAGTRCTRLANPGDAVLLTAAPDPGAALLRWTGACAAAGASPTCTVTALGASSVSALFGFPVQVSSSGTGLGHIVSTPPGIDCGSGCAHAFPVGRTLTLTAAPDSASAFGGWSGACAGASTTCVLTLSAPLSVGARFDAATRLEQDGPGTAYGWGAARDLRAIGGSYRWDRRRGASITWRFRGRKVTVFSVDGPAMGTASVAIDGRRAGWFDGYAAALRTGVGHRYSGLGPGYHTLSVTASGRHAARSRGSRVALDALRWGGALHADPRPASATWGTISAAAASGATYVESDVAGASASLRFTGTGISLITVRGPRMGVAELWVDGTRRRVLDLFAPRATYGVERSVTGLSDSTHLVRLVIVGGSRPASGRSVALDGWVVR